jgi:hypothetical protein
MANRAIEYVYKIIDQYTQVMKKMSASTNVFKKDIEKAKQKAEQLGKNLKRIAMIGVAAFGAAVVKLTYDSIKAWDQQVAALKSVEATLRSTNNVAKRSLGDLEKQASSLQQNTFFGDETILQNVTAQMLTFTNITESQFDRAQKSVLDVTAKLYGLNASGESTQAVTIQLAKALNDPIANLGALSRSGIQFSKQQKEMIKGLVNSGQLWKAQNIILTEIEKQYGGTAEALTQTAQGMALQNRNMIGDIKEMIGKGIEPLRMKWLKFVNSFLKKIDATKLTAWIEKTSIKLDKFFTGLETTLRRTWKVFFAVYKVIKPFIPLILILITSIIAARKIYMAWIIVQWLLNSATWAFPGTWIVLAIAALIAIIIILIVYHKQIIAFTVKWYDRLKGLVLIFGGPLAATLIFFIEIIRSIIKHWDVITEKFKSGDILGGLLEIGKAIIDGMLSPIISLLELIGKIPFMKGLTENALKGIDKLKTKLGINIGEDKGIKTPVGQKTTQNVNVKSNISVYTEKGMKVDPFVKRNNLGYQMSNPYGN